MKGIAWLYSYCSCDEGQRAHESDETMVNFLLTIYYIKSLTKIKQTLNYKDIHIHPVQGYLQHYTCPGNYCKIQG